jgi:hypothetical protein
VRQVAVHPLNKGLNKAVWHITQSTFARFGACSMPVVCVMHAFGLVASWCLYRSELSCVWCVRQVAVHPLKKGLNKAVWHITHSTFARFGACSMPVVCVMRACKFVPDWGCLRCLAAEPCASAYALCSLMKWPYGPVLPISQTTYARFEVCSMSMVCAICISGSVLPVSFCVCSVARCLLYMLLLRRHQPARAGCCSNTCSCAVATAAKYAFLCF